MTHLALDASTWRDAPSRAREIDGPVVVSVTGLSTPLVVAALATSWRRPIGVWLEVHDGYPAALAARDVATLSWLVELDHVVVAAADHGREHAEVLAALLVDDEVTLTNAVASLSGAFNRPAPPRPVTVWFSDGDDLVALDGARLRGATSVDSSRSFD